MSKMNNQSRLVQRKKRRRRRIFKTLITLSVIVFLAAGGGLVWAWQQASNLAASTFVDLDRDRSNMREDVVDIGDDNISVLFLGVDNRDEQVSGISDAMILATFNQNENSVKMLSIPRDSYVDIPGYSGHEKINHAHAYDGHDLAVETVENFLNVPVDYYATINFQAFIDIVDTFDGVDIDSEFSFSEQDAYGNHDQIFIEEGLQTLSGEEALAYVRHRETDGDLARGERQTEVMVSLIDEAISISNIGNYDQVFADLQNNMNHNLGTFGDISSFHSYASSLDEMERFQLEGEFTRIEGTEYIIIDDTSLANATNALRSHLEIDEDDENNAEDINSDE